MRNTILSFGIAAAMLAATASVASADTWDKKTNITVNETILVPGKALPPGNYVMKLLNSSSNRNIVQIFNDDQTRLEATILAFNNYRLHPEDKTVLTYWETPSGVPPAIRSWFYPGDNHGQEFAYPKAQAEQIARANNNARVPYFEGAQSPKADDLPSLQVRQAPDNSNQPTPAPVESKETPAPQSPISQVEQPDRSDRDAPAVIAQNDPARTPIPPPAEPQSSEREQAKEPEPPSELPATATNVPLIAMGGVMMLGIAVMLSRRRA